MSAARIRLPAGPRPARRGPGTDTRRAARTERTVRGRDARRHLRRVRPLAAPETVKPAETAGWDDLLDAAFDDEDPSLDREFERMRRLSAARRREEPPVT